MTTLAVVLDARRGHEFDPPHGAPRVRRCGGCSTPILVCADLYDEAAIIVLDDRASVGHASDERFTVDGPYALPVDRKAPRATSRTVHHCP